MRWPHWCYSLASTSRAQVLRSGGAEGVLDHAHRAVLVGAMGDEHLQELRMQSAAPALGAEDGLGLLLECAHKGRVLLGELGLAGHEEAARVAAAQQLHTIPC